MSDSYLQSFICVITLIILAQIINVYANGVEFGYGIHDGPHQWPFMFEQCGQTALRQSPINVVTKYARAFPFTPLFFINPEVPWSHATITNNGHSVVITLDDENEKPLISGGPLFNHVFKLAQIHFHWAKSDRFGSENKIDDKAADMEMHMVFFNTKYGSFEEATAQYQKEKDALVVLGVFMNASHEDNDLFNFTDELFNIQNTSYPKISLQFWKYFHEFLPHDTDKYFTYAGSLTTPPCTEHVTWILFWRPLSISYRQMDNFRQIRDHYGFTVLQNARFLQKSNRRLIRYPRQHIADIHQYSNRNQRPARKIYNNQRRQLQNGQLSQNLLNIMNSASGIPHIYPTTTGVSRIYPAIPEVPRIYPTNSKKIDHNWTQQQFFGNNGDMMSPSFN